MCKSPGVARGGGWSGLELTDALLKYKETTKYLGIILDGNLTWESHIKELNQKLIKYTGIWQRAILSILYIMLSYSLDLIIDLKST